jgi:sulfhydrogenase subunit beta (sulfur reductase)
VAPDTGLDALVDVLHSEGYRVVGPVVRDGVITTDDVVDGAELPRGHTVEQAPGHSRLHHGEGAERFSWTPGAESWKRFVFPARSEVLRVRRVDGTFAVASPPPPERPLALLGARACEIRALDVLDRVHADPDHPDPRYIARRADAFVVAVTCGVPSATCWCTSIGGGPEATDGYDLRLTELPDDGRPHRLLVEAGSTSGAAVLAELPGTTADDVDLAAAASVVAGARERLPRRVLGEELPSLLAGHDHDPHWSEVAERCLSCGSCTSVCPTCFCSSIEDVDGSDPAETVREQVWVSCFQLDHSNLGGRPVRSTTAARYRQWLTHKLQTWTEQFGTTGCVGCGRCTTWCPAGIDLVAEAVALAPAAAVPVLAGGGDAP